MIFDILFIPVKMRAGETSEVKEMTPEVIEICNQIKAALEEKLGAPCDVFEPKSFKSQVRLSNPTNF